MILGLILLLLGSNYIWYRIHKREENKFTHALIPPLSNDYFSTQVTLTNQIKENQIELEKEEKASTTNYLSTKWQIDVNLINQLPKYPNGCEAATATMLLNYHKIDMTLEEFTQDILSKDIVYEIGRKRYGPDPSKVYAGDPSSENRGWGCFEPVIVNSIKKVFDRFQNNKIQIITNSQKKSLEWLSFLKTPIMIWTTIDYQEVSEVYEWLSYDSKNTFTYPKNSHAVLITGVDEMYYYLNDPLKKEKNIPIKKDQLEKSFDSMGRQAIAFHYT